MRYFLCLLFSLGALGAEIIQRDCDSGESLGKGSALVFRSATKTLALTSARLGGKGCFEVGKLPAKVVVSDWSRDLALFEISDELAPELPQPSSTTIGRVTVKGKEFSILSSTSTRFSLPFHKTLIEIIGKPVDSSLVGAPVLAPDGSWVGLVSRQYLKMIPGSSTHPRNWAEKESQGHLLVLPAKEVKAWVESGGKASLAEPIDEGTISSGFHDFHLDCPEAGDPAMIGPIGGPEGVGSGGHGPAFPFCSAKITSRSVALVPWPFATQVSEGRLLYFVRRGPNGLERVPFWDLEGLIRAFEKSENLPVVETGEVPGLSLIRELYSEDFGVAEVYRLLRALYLAVQARQWLTPQDAQSLVDPKGKFQWAWYQLDLRFPKETESLRNLFARRLPITAFTPYIVKIRSGLCSDPDRFVGSGLLFSHEGKAYVVTSDHVVLHNYQSSTCHTVESEHIGTIKAEFRVAEWGMGVALLAIPTIPSVFATEGWLMLGDLSPPLAVEGQHARVLGFPAGDTSLFDSPGRISRLERRLPFFALLQELIELEDTHGEFGMSGGPAFTDAGFLGILSHQSLDTEQNRLFLIPATVVTQWLKEMLPHGILAKPYFQLEFDAQLLGQDSVNGAETSFDYWRMEDFHHTTKQKTVVLQRFPDTNRRSYRDPFNRLPPAYRFLLDPSTHTHLRLRYFREGGLSKQARLVPVEGLVDFFQKIHVSKYEPIFIQPWGLDQWTAARELKRLAREIKEGPETVLALAHWLSQIPDSIEDLDESWTLVTTQDVRDIFHHEEISSEQRNKLETILQLLGTLLLP